MIERIVCNLNNYEQLKDKIIRFLESRGRIKAALLHKLENYFCSSKSKYNIGKDELLSFLFMMMKDRIIEIIIPELFKVKWKKYYLKDLKYLEDANYLCRIFIPSKSKFINGYRPNDYYFDSRKINHNDPIIIEQYIEHLRLISQKIKYLNKKIIIFYPFNSNPIEIYEKQFKGDYQLNSININVEKKESLDPKIRISLEEQAEDIAIIKAYRNKYMCFYIPLIESILKLIEDIQKKRDFLKDYKTIFHNYARKFAYQCIEFVRSDYIEIIEPNPYRWETFFKFFDIDIKILNYDFKSIIFYGRTFETYCNLKYCIFIKKTFKDIITNLEEIGYIKFPEENYDDKIAIGFDIDYYIPYCTIEQIYFVSKYVCYYHSFLLFNHAFEYIKKIKPNIKFAQTEKTLYLIFLPVMQALFDIKEDSLINKKLVFKYYTYDSDELELIYNKFLLKNIKFIEKKMFSYFLIKYLK